MSKVNLAHPIGHKLKYNGKHIAVGGQWHDLWGGNFDGFTVFDSEYYWIDNKYTTYGNNIETDIESSSAPSPGVRTFGYLETYNEMVIPNTRLNDNFVMLEIPFNPYRITRNRTTLQNNMDNSVLKVGVMKTKFDSFAERYMNSFSFNITSTPTSVIETGDDGEGMRYGVGSWSHTLSIPNISYTNTFTRTSEQPAHKIRLLCDLNTKKTYFKIAYTFPNDVVLSDYIDTGFSMPIDPSTDQHIQYQYRIYVYANGIGIKAYDNKPLEFLIAGYHVGAGTPITLKSYDFIKL